MSAQFTKRLTAIVLSSNLLSSILLLWENLFKDTKGVLYVLPVGKYLSHPAADLGMTQPLRLRLGLCQQT
jgi:hypothetical protein